MTNSILIWTVRTLTAHNWSLILLGEVKDSMEEDIIEDSMNMETEETPLQNKVHQLEQEVKRLKRIIKEERAKNKQLEFALYNKVKSFMFSFGSKAIKFNTFM